MNLLAELVDLVVPRECAGCGVVGVGWCDDCRGAFSVVPTRVSRLRVDPGVPCWTLGRYDGARREVILAAKERGRRDLAGPMGELVAHGLRSIVAVPPVLVPAPTRRAAARRRGGDPVARAATAAARLIDGSVVAPALRLERGARDSVGLSAAQRRANIAEHLRCDAARAREHRSNVVVIDDVVTTGATLSESVRALRAEGFQIVAAMTLTAA